MKYKLKVFVSQIWNAVIIPMYRERCYRSTMFDGCYVTKSMDQTDARHFAHHRSLLTRTAQHPGERQIEVAQRALSLMDIDELVGVDDLTQEHLFINVRNSSHIEVLLRQI